MNEMTAYESALGCSKEGSDGATKETEETTNKRNDEVVSGDWVANEGRGNGGLDGWGCLMVSCTLASHANLTTSYKPVSVHSWCRVKCEVSSRQQTVRGEGFERGGDFPMEKGDALRSRALRWCIIVDCQGHAQYCTVSKLGNEGITLK